jgi:hypothetical protein
MRRLRLRTEPAVPRPTIGNWKPDDNTSYAEGDMPPEAWDAQVAVQDLNDLFKARRAGRRDAQPAPDILYHYTDLRGLHGMLESFVMWLSDAAYMNDPLEGTWVHKRAVVLASEVLGESPLAVRTLEQIEAQLNAPDLWDPSIRGGDSNHLHAAAMSDAFMPAFIASFTEAGDLLSQ